MGRKSHHDRIERVTRDLHEVSSQMASAENALRLAHTRVKLLRAEYVRLYQKLLALNGNKQRKPVFSAVFGTSKASSDTATAPSATSPRPRRVAGKRSGLKTKEAVEAVEVARIPDLVERARLKSSSQD
jgi:hypothetical protein